MKVHLGDIYKDLYGNTYEVVEVIELGRSLEDILVRLKVIISTTHNIPEGKTFLVDENRLLLKKEYTKL
jgi:hypothetical protein